MAIGCLSEAETFINPFHTARTPTLITTTAVQPFGTAVYKSSADSISKMSTIPCHHLHTPYCL